MLEIHKNLMLSIFYEIVYRRAPVHVTIFTAKFYFWIKFVELNKLLLREQLIRWR